MRRVGDAAWRYFGSRTDAAKAFGVSVQDVTRLISDPSTAPVHVREALEARLAPALKKQVIKWKLSGRTVAVTPVLVGRAPSKKRGLFVEGAAQKVNGKWSNSEMFPGREFDDLDAYRAAKKQRKERRAAYADNYLR